jgi:hypothetical protein
MRSPRTHGNDPKSRIERLEAGRDTSPGLSEEAREFYSGLRVGIEEEEALRASRSRDHAPELLAWLKALQLAPVAELEELAGLWIRARDEGREEPTPEDDPDYHRLREAMMRRVAPTFADDLRVRRCLLWRELHRLGRESEEQGRRGPAFYVVSSAETNRATALSCHGAEPLLDHEEARRRAALIASGEADRDEVLELIQWR